MVINYCNLSESIRLLCQLKRRKSLYSSLLFRIFTFKPSEGEAGPTYLGSGLAAGLGLSCHGSLELKGQLHILDLHPLHLDPPVVSSIIQSGLRKKRDKIQFVLPHL